MDRTHQADWGGFPDRRIERARFVLHVVQWRDMRKEAREAGSLGHRKSQAQDKMLGLYPEATVSQSVAGTNRSRDSDDTHRDIV